MNIPPVQLVRQTAPTVTVADVPGATRRAWLESDFAARVKPGMRIAVGCGSRGIKNYAVIARATVEALKELGAKPFVVAAMGSHGGATPEGQRRLLAHYGVDEKHLGVPVVTDMDAVQLGTNSWGEPVWWDKNALAADGVVTVSRVKPHTDFRGRFESGIVKMLVIGLGKRHGADQHHSWGTRGLRDMMLESVKVILAKAPVLGGLAIVENAQEETAHLEVVDRDAILEREPALLDEARRLMGRIPFPALDLLIVGECGKNYSGAGMDPNVVGRMLIEASPEAETNVPRVTRMACLDVSPESEGNGTGIGIADLTTTRALAAIDPVPFRMNNLTARFLWRSKLPIAFETDRECIQSAVDTCWNPIEDRVQMCIVPNTLEVAELWVSPALAAVAAENADLEVVGSPMTVPFDAAGNLIQEKLFPHSVRGQRSKAGH
ncbi:lactate racemase domain-containing protein [Fimbriiglobus ruber]|uniref:Iron-sulfur cluster binding protein n=1 Tax=Fimbriiglobus ruber TaxID=1908690 RepID=A0A225DFV6_9BACT|nr:lactate racemase domain-containing protein [Fimbriiglobus ruber]OWK38524.1 Iron-sulfur cluster binding protein [Fimbriiglobus ruber]